MKPPFSSRRRTTRARDRTRLEVDHVRDERLDVAVVEPVEQLGRVERGGDARARLRRGGSHVSVTAATL